MTIEFGLLCSALDRRPLAGRRLEGVNDVGHQEVVSPPVVADELDPLADAGQRRGVLEIGRPTGLAFHLERPGAADRRPATLVDRQTFLFHRATL